MSEKKYKKRILFVGMPDMALHCLRKLCENGINIVGVVPPVKTHNSYKPLIVACKEYGLKVIEFEKDLKEEKFLSELKELNIDLGAVASYAHKIPKEMLDLAKDGFINLHPSKLPDYRGGNPYSHVIINGEKQSAITLHYMDETFDTGDIISQYKFPLYDDETMGTLFSRTNKMCASMLYEALDYYETHTFPRRPQPEKKHFKTAPTLSFEKRNIFIDWNKSATEIERFIRSLNPFIGALTYYKGNILRINYAYVEKKFHNHKPGEIADVRDTLKVACGKDLLEVDSLQYAGFYLGSGFEFVQRENVKKGEFLYRE